LLCRHKDLSANGKAVALLHGGHSEVERFDAIQVIVDIPAFAANIAGSAGYFEAIQRAHAEIEVSPEQFRIDVVESQRLWVAVHGRDHLNGTIDNAHRPIERHSLNEIVHAAIEHRGTQ
jgi:hypothetical protein